MTTQTLIAALGLTALIGIAQRSVVKNAIGIVLIRVTLCKQERKYEMTDIEQEVSEAMAADPNYPLGETDAMKWAVAWRHVRDRNGIDANASQASGDIDGWMVGWFANCMASAPEAVKMRREAGARA